MTDDLLDIPEFMLDPQRKLFDETRKTQEADCPRYFIAWPSWKIVIQSEVKP